jgi:hypothetical protein
VSKAVGVIAALLSLGLGFVVFRTRVGVLPALIASGLCALVYLGFSNVTFWTRADPLLLLCSVLALFGTTRRNPTAAALWIGVAMGVAVNLKITGILYVAPPLALFAGRGTRAVLVAGGIAAVLGVAPFLASSISFANYFEYLQLSARDGVVWQKVRQNLLWAAFLSAPLAVVWWRASRPRQLTQFGRGATAVLVASIVTVAVVTAKAGGGPFHLLPFVPVLAYGAVSIWSECQRPWLAFWLAPIAVLAIVPAVRSQRTLIRTVDYRDQDRVVEDLRKFAGVESGRRLAVGYAGTSYVSYLRPEIVFRTRDYWLDAPAIQEHQRAGVALPEATLRRLRDCHVDIWLVPRQGEPFAVPNVYFADERVDVFPLEFREIFQQRYEHTGSTEFFDIWRCRR